MSCTRHLATFCFAVIAAAPTIAGVVRFTATINAAQETTGSTSSATGSAVLLYDVGSNRFDLTVTLNGFSNTLTASHIHEGAIGVAGSVVTNLGAEAVYTRNGDTLTATFLDVVHGGTPATLIAGNAYVNFHSGAFPNGEVRGQLVPDPVKLTAVFNGAGENPPNNSAAYGAIQAIYHPTTNKVDALVSIYNFTNTLSNSHIHDGAVGVNGGVTAPFGPASVYVKAGNTYTNAFTGISYTGNPVLLLSGGSYFNVHSNVLPAGEIRGVLFVADPGAAGRLVNVSARGQVGTGDNVLIAGFSVQGPQAVRVLVTARGPFLSGFGVTGVLANPQLSVADSSGRVLLTNDDFASAPVNTLLTGLGFAPSVAAESAVILVLPPGTYTSVVSGAGNTTGVALAEVFELPW